jgi:hypothetical protein
MRCNQCEAAMINGVFCHETGCPNINKRFIDGEWVRVRECVECGNEIAEGESCCEAEVYQKDEALICAECGHCVETLDEDEVCETCRKK